MYVKNSPSKIKFIFKKKSKKETHH